MNREIKFRVWNGQEMLYADKAYVGAGSGVSVLLMDMMGKCSWNNPYGFAPEEPAGDILLMQYTGLKDKNGKEIYEGDTIRVPDDYEWFGYMAGEDREVCFLDGCFRLKPKEDGNGGRGHVIEDAMDECEVIGNIYESNHQ